MELPDLLMPWSRPIDPLDQGLRAMPAKLASWRHWGLDHKLEQRSYCCRAMGISLGQWQRHPETKRRIMVAGSGATFFDEGPPDAPQSLWQVRALDFQGMGKSAMGQGPTHPIKPASRRCRPIAVSFHRLFLDGLLLPSRARFRFAGYARGIRSILSHQGHASGFYACRKNSHTERSPLDSAHISSADERYHAQQ
jgi:hypothetical protein